MPVLTFQAVPVDKMRQYKVYEAYYNEQHREPGTSVEPELLNVTYEDTSAKQQQQPQLTDEFREIEDLFKARYQGPARVILSIVRRSGGKMDRYQRLIYPNGQLGSSLYELVRYAVIPPRTRKAQPIDFAQFARLLREQSAPSYILAKLGGADTATTVGVGVDMVAPVNGGDRPWLALPQ
jgi:hypothetical protein